MGRKDSPGPSLPVDNYRRTIGKQEYEKNKKELKKQKRQADTKKSKKVHQESMLQDLLLMTISFVAMASLIYFLLYMYMKEPHMPGKDEM